MNSFDPVAGILQRFPRRWNSTAAQKTLGRALVLYRNACQGCTLVQSRRAPKVVIRGRPRVHGGGDTEGCLATACLGAEGGVAKYL